MEGFAVILLIWLVWWSLPVFGWLLSQPPPRPQFVVHSYTYDEVSYTYERTHNGLKATEHRTPRTVYYRSIPHYTNGEYIGSDFIALGRN
jgi:hypothetical protein